MVSLVYQRAEGTPGSVRPVALSCAFGSLPEGGLNLRYHAAAEHSNASSDGAVFLVFFERF
jgi:hypothetical protein